MLQPATKEDTRFFFSLYMHPAINPYLLYDPMTEDEFQPIFDDLLAKGVLYKFQADGVDVGMCKLVPQYHRNAHSLYLGGVAIHPGYTGKGYGLRMMGEIISLAREKRLKRIELSTAIDNTAAIRLYERAGFAIEGRMRNYTWLKNEDRFVDEYLMSWIP
ncbi:GNAT family N-acetyltransferase [Flavihumibacter fluvii]|uniref:GNAT family N-acetyltransferase n=1 Tax=Flavihumibacter fluvii TaxID=2838157 RepID=UPI001BDF28A9|nr:GNAT family protein [Flavihumibacter fluvii]ULQ51898.1 GNAT family N-acetyltransferase [Flavihumibacter fluvii]